MQFNQSEIPALLRELETEHGVKNAVDDRQSLIDSAAAYRTSRYRLGKALTAYRAHFPHGSWLTALDAVGAVVGIKARTLRDIITDYEHVADLPAKVIADLESKGIDPAAKKNRRIVSIASGEGFNTATDEAQDEGDDEDNEEPIQPQTQSITSDERRILKVRDSLQSLLANVAPNRKVEVLKQAIGEAIWSLIGPDAAFTLKAMEPTFDLSGRRRKWVA